MRAMILGVFSDIQTNTYETMDNTLQGKLTKFSGSHSKGKDYQQITTITTPWEEYDLIYLVGLGDSTKYDVTKHRKLIGHVAKQCLYPATIVLDTFFLPHHKAGDFAKATAEAIQLAQQEHIHVKSKQKPTEPVPIKIQSNHTIASAVQEGELLASAVKVARDLQNTPANDLTPTDLANVVRSFGEKHQLQIDILEKAEMEALGMGGLLGVNQGSAEAPKMIVAKYQNGETSDVLGLVGKGITFDTGGYTMKIGKQMYGMHFDMAGAATMFGAFAAIVKAKLPINVLLVIPSTDNMVSGTSLKPSDVITMMDGTSVEVNDTDAEGRLILADALLYAQKLGATHLINAATLTYAVIQALGTETTGTFTNNQAFLDTFLTTAKANGEAAWQLPIMDTEKKLIREASQVADLMNCPDGPDGIVAAAFLESFVKEDIPWIHLDIAGTANTSKAHELGPQGATGVMIRTIFALAKGLE